MLAEQYASHNRQRNLAKNRKKNEKLQKIKKNSSNFLHFFVIFFNKKMTLTHKIVNNCYHKISQVEGVSPIPI